MASVKAQTEVISEHFQSNIDTQEQGPLFCSGQVVGFDEQFEQVAQVVLDAVAQRKLLAAWQTFEHRERVL